MVDVGSSGGAGWKHQRQKEEDGRRWIVCCRCPRRPFACRRSSSRPADSSLPCCRTRDPASLLAVVPCTVRLRRRRRRTSRPAPPARPRSDIGFNYSPPGQYRRPRPPAGSVVACTECSVGHLRPRAPAPFRFPKTAVADI